MTWKRLRIEDNGEIPRLVAVETTNFCNASCAFCPSSAFAGTAINAGKLAKIAERRTG